MILLQIAHYFSTLHILDSLGMKEAAREETARLQKILEQHYDGKTFKQGWLMSSVPNVRTIFPSLP